MNPSAGPVGSEEPVGMEESEARDWLRLAALELRPRLARRLVEHYGGPGAVFNADPGELLRMDGVNRDLVDRIAAGAAPARMPEWLAAAQRLKITVLPFTSPQFPLLLHEIADPPAVLLVRGCVSVLQSDAVAMVGTRMATRYGKMAAESVARDLAASGVVVVSGGALGIDAAVHRAACSAGVTVAVLGCGLDVRYPASNQALFDEIVEKGAVISEFPFGARPDTWRFPARNRIISGLARATVVVEAAERSGALITASCAADQGREVMAVPGPIHSPQSRGCHALIRDGATLVENAGQVMETLGWRQTAAPAILRPAAPVLPDLPLDQGALLLALGQSQRHLDELTSECGLSASQAGAAMTLLELRGLVRRVPGNLFVRA